jgi:hypothetical protein
MSMLVATLVDGDRQNWRARGPWAACGITELHLVSGSWQVARLNDHQHLIEKMTLGEI